MEKNDRKLLWKRIVDEEIINYLELDKIKSNF